MASTEGVVFFGGGGTFRCLDGFGGDDFGSVLLDLGLGWEGGLPWVVPDGDHEVRVVSCS